MGRSYRKCSQRKHSKSTEGCAYFEWTSKPSVSSASSSARNNNGISDLASADFVMYTDGACLGNKNVSTTTCPAGFGVVVLTNVSGDDEASANVLASLYGPVCRNVTSPYYLGAEVSSNNTAELSAIGEALIWLRDNGPLGSTAVIRYDSEYAAKSVQGIFNGEKNRLLIQNIRAILTMLRSSGYKVFFSHVKGHSAHRWNDEADRLANEGSSGVYSEQYERGMRVITI
jgi:ribonuclease HI